MAITTIDGSDLVASAPTAPPVGRLERTPLALLRFAATALPQALLNRLAAVVVRSLAQSHPRLILNLERSEPAVIHIAPTDLPYAFALRVGRAPITLAIIDPRTPGADASVAASVATLIDLLEGRIDSDTLFFRRDLTISGSTAAVVGLRNLLDREEMILANELALPFGPLARPVRAAARVFDHALDRVGARVAAMHRTLHPPAESGQDVAAELEQCRGEIAALTARLGRLEARQKRRDETPK